MRKKDIYLDGLKVVYFIGGQGKPVLFLHGGKIRALTYKRNLKLLAQKYLVVAPDIPGFGASDSPSKIWDYNDYNAFFDVFMKQLRLKDVTVIGHSMGGGLAFHLACNNAVVSKLILVNANGVGFSGKNALLIQLERIIFYITSPQYWETFSVLIKDAMVHYTRHFFASSNIRRDYTGSEQILRKIHIPTLLLWSNHDSIFPLSIAKTFHTWIKNSTLEVVDGNHDWPLYNPELFYKKVVEFVK
jgi:pimeloyl-ACP methyl ester carboxylesterase